MTEETTGQRGAETEEATSSAQLGDGRSRIANVASTLAGGASAIAEGAGSVIAEAVRLIGERPGARVRRVRRMGREPLPNLWDLHPEARRGSLRELGLISVPLDQIRGTAVEGPGQRSGDFLPLKDRRSEDWRARWQRILRAAENLENLPPVELIRFDDGYWVVDGHNRVAAALYIGQVEIDAVVEDLRMPGTRSDAPTNIGPVLEGSLDLRAAGAGRHSRTVNRREDVSGIGRHAHGHAAPEDAARDEES